METRSFRPLPVAITEKPELNRIEPATATARPVSHRAVAYPDGRHEVPVFGRDQLQAGHQIQGPAVIEEPASVTILNPGQRLAVDAYGHLVIERA